MKIIKNKRFGKLLVLEVNNQIIKCLCDCGTIKEFLKSNLLNNKSKCCGKGVCQSHFKDISNQKFGFLIAIEYVGSDTNHGALWKCLCDCGNYCNVRGNSLRQGRTKSCGCKTRKLISIKNSKEFGFSNYMQLYNNYKNNAKLKNIDFDLEFADFKIATTKDCYYCGALPNQKLLMHNINGERCILYNGLDRQDNTKGYNITNIVTSCGICNIAKSDMSLLDFLIWVKRISTHLSEIGILDRE